MFDYDDNMMIGIDIHGTFLNISGCISKSHILLNCCMHRGTAMLGSKIIMMFSKNEEFFLMPNKMFPLNCVKKNILFPHVKYFSIQGYTNYILYKLALHKIYNNRRADEYIENFKRILYIVLERTFTAPGHNSDTN